jgi:hypothetical protein
MSPAMIERAMDVIIARGAARRAQSDPEIQVLRPAETGWLTEVELKQLERLRLAWVRKQYTTEEIQERVIRKREERRWEMQDAALYPYRRKMLERGVSYRMQAMGLIRPGVGRPWTPQDLADAVWGAAWAAATEVAMKLVWDVMQEKPNREEG